MSFHDAQKIFREPRRTAIRRQLEGSEAFIEALDVKLTAIETLLARILVEFQGQRTGVNPMRVEAQPDEGGFLKRWLG